MPEHRVQCMVDYKRPKTRKDLRAFLGAVVYYRRFIKDFANYSAVLSPYTSSKAPGIITWTPRMLEAFQSLRVSLCNCCVLNIPSVNDVYELHTDASGLWIGEVLNVVRDRDVLPVAFFSRQMSETERRYSATKMEALAVVAAVEPFAHFLYGASFVVYTDHRPLVSLLSSRILNRRLRGMPLKLSGYDIDIRYRKGSDNGYGMGFPGRPGKLR